MYVSDACGSSGCEATIWVITTSLVDMKGDVAFSFIFYSLKYVNYEFVIISK